MVNAFKNLFSRKGQGVGIELAPDRLNIVQLSKKGANYKLETFATTEIDEGLIEEGIIADPPEMARLIQMTLADHNLKPKRVATALPSREGVIRIIPVPVELSDDELKEMVNQEAGLYLPFPREDAALDYQKLGEFDDESGIRKIQVLLVATRKEVTETYINTFNEAGLAIDVLEVTSFSLMRTLREQLLQLPPEEPVVLTDIEFDTTEIAILQDGIPQFSRTIPIGTYQIQTAISEAMNLPPSRNTDMLKEMTMPANPTEMTGGGKMGENNDGTPALIKVLSELADELRRSIDFYINQSEGLDVAQMILAGPGTVIQQIDEFFSQRLSLATMIVDPVTALSLECEEEQISQVPRQGLGIVLGLGMREV